MPVISTQPVLPVAPTVAYERLAFRCSFNAKTAAGAVADGGSLALVATKYRKLVSPDGTAYLDTLGIPEAAEKAASLTYGMNQVDDELMNGIAAAVSGYVGVNGQTTMNFSWRVERGDVVGMIHLTVKPENGEEVTRLTGNSNQLEAQDPAFAKAFVEVIDLLSAWCSARGW